METVSGQCLTLLHQHYPHAALHEGHRGRFCYCRGIIGQLYQTTGWSIWVCTVSRMRNSSSPVVGVPGETGLLSAGVSGQCRPPHCGPQVAAGEAAPSRFAAFHFLLASPLDPQQAQSVLGSAIENLRCLLSVKAETYYFGNTTSGQNKNGSTVMTPHRVFFFYCDYVCADDATGTKSG